MKTLKNNNFIHLIHISSIISILIFASIFIIKCFYYKIALNLFIYTISGTILGIALIIYGTKINNKICAGIGIVSLLFATITHVAYSYMCLICPNNRTTVAGMIVSIATAMIIQHYCKELHNNEENR